MAFYGSDQSLGSSQNAMVFQMTPPVHIGNAAAFRAIRLSRL